MKTIPHSDPVRRARDSVLTPLLWLCAGIALGILIQWLREDRAARPAPPPARLETRIMNPAPSDGRPGKTFPDGKMAAAAPLERLRQLVAPGASPDFLEAGLLIRQLQASECKSALNILRRFHGNQRNPLIDTFAAHWAKLNPYAAFDAAQAEIHDNNLRSRLGSAAGAELAARDPLIALERIRSTRNKGLREKAAEWILPPLTKTNPEMATGVLESLPYNQYSDLYLLIAREYGRTSPREALAWAESLSEDRGRAALTFAWVGWAETNPNQAAAAIAASGKTLSPDVYGMIAARMSLDDPFAALRWAQSLPARESEAGALRQIQFDTDKLGPAAARDYIMAMEKPEDRMNFAPRLAQQLAREDVARGLAFAESLPEGDLRYQALDPVLSDWSARDAEAAARYIATLPEDHKSGHLMPRSIHQWMENDPNAAVAFIENLPAGVNRDLGASAAINTMRDQDPQKALQLFEMVQDPVVRGNVAKNLAASLVKTDPATALSLAAEVPAKEQPDTYKGLVRNWAQEQPGAAGAWINNLPPGKERDAAVGAYVSVIDGKDARLATQWAQSIGDPLGRLESGIRAFSKWADQDRAAATAWLEATPDISDRTFYEKYLSDEEFAKRIKD